MRSGMRRIGVAWMIGCGLALIAQPLVADGEIELSVLDLGGGIHMLQGRGGTSGSPRVPMGSCSSTTSTRR